MQIRCAQGAELHLEADADDTGPKWVQVAYEGDFQGYFNGEEMLPFKFTRLTFEQIIANLHRNPSYQAGPDGVGIKPVIPWDFHHASEMDPSSGNIAAEGTPSQGWTYELQIRTNQEGKSELWALTEFLEPARTFVIQKKYRWASVTVYFESVDPHTGENTGAMISSIALTNTPFLEGMAELAAQRNAQQKGGKSHGVKLRWYEAAGSPSEALEMMKDCLGLPRIATISEVNIELGKLQTWISSGTIPLGVDAESISEDIRKILNLPALTPISEVFQTASQTMSGLLNEPSLVNNNGATNAAQIVNPPTGGGDIGGETIMDELLKKLAGLLGVKAIEGEVMEAVNDAIDLRRRSAEAVGATRQRTEDIVIAAEQAVSNSNGFSALLKALGTDSLSTAVEKITSLLALEKELAEIKPKFEELQEAARTVEEKAIETEVAAALTRFPEDIREQLQPALTLERKSDPKAFAEKYPPVTTEQVALTSHVAVSSTGQQLPVSGNSGDGQFNLSNRQTVDLGLFEGKNPTERARSFVLSRKDLFGEIQHPDTLWKRACQIKNNELEMQGLPHFIDSRANGGR